MEIIEGHLVVFQFTKQGLWLVGPEEEPGCRKLWDNCGPRGEERATDSLERNLESHSWQELL